jgi:hypothetical protein
MKTMRTESALTQMPLNGNQKFFGEINEKQVKE